MTTNLSKPAKSRSRAAGRKLSKAQTAEILNLLAELYPETKSELVFANPFQLLIATMLSAQTTDRQVNAITARLFREFKRPEDLAAITAEQLEEWIKSCGLYKNKARNIVATCRVLVRDYGSNIPRTFAELVELPGVGRKTANVVLANAFGHDVIAVDTHVFRVANRLGLTEADTPEKTEEELMRAIPAGLRNKAHHWLIFHGRRVCKAQKPDCGGCTLATCCRYFGKSSVGTKNLNDNSGNKSRK